MPASNSSHAFDHMVVVLFENRSQICTGICTVPEDGKNFDGVMGKT